jgi:hypothetical protein
VWYQYPVASIRTILVTAVVAAFALPSVALAQSAGDNQYVDPLAGQHSQPTHHAAQPQQGSSPSQSAAPSAPAPSTAAPATSGAAPTTSSGSAAGAPQSTSVPLAHTGFDAWIPAVAGIALIGAAVMLRRGARQRRA